MRVYKHIDDCWNAIREAQSVSEVKQLFEEFPRWSGDWSIDRDKYCYVVTNSYDDKDMGWQEDEETLDLELESEEEEQ